MKKIFLMLMLTGSAQFIMAQKCYNLDELLRTKVHPVYEKHLQASRKFNIKVLKDTKTLTKYKQNGKLSPVKSLGKGYRIQNLSHSKPVLVHEAKNTLKEIAKKFSANSKGSTLTLTSMTRTLEDQCRLRKVNPNASVGLSSHNYGNSFDISYVRFNDRLAVNSRLDKILENVLKEFEKSGKIYFIKERQQNCYHITVRA
ncbi:hypothetical protein J8J42_08270 [Chryseobacterium sp. cx-311]|uniref:DUF5715 family protein n=1 Tax=Marnyiella aurantia TaxID=2758037 RepID=UPI001AE85C99|nr:DUF5715 family protein [Marnyiella aurantia]MBP0613040.1 hypothetical protein [Marnyiella aurantia]